MLTKDKMKECSCSKEKKRSGQVYTPSFIVSTMLNFSGYFSCSILKKHIIDNNWGDGAFLVEIVSRYCREFLKLSSNCGELKVD